MKAVEKGYPKVTVILVVSDIVITQPRESKPKARSLQSHVLLKKGKQRNKLFLKQALKSASVNI